MCRSFLILLFIELDCVQSRGEGLILTVFEVEVTGGLGRPQSHGVDDVVPVAGDWGVIGKSQNHLSQIKSRCVLNTVNTIVHTIWKSDL